MIGIYYYTTIGLFYFIACTVFKGVPYVHNFGCWLYGYVLFHFLLMVYWWTTSYNWNENCYCTVYNSYARDNVRLKLFSYKFNPFLYKLQTFNDIDKKFFVVKNKSVINDVLETNATYSFFLGIFLNCIYFLFYLTNLVTVLENN